MTETRILKIISDLTYRTKITTKELLLAKQVAEIAVNEAIQECVDRADVKQNTAFKYVWEVDIDKLLNLKVK